MGTSMLKELVGEALKRIRDKDSEGFELRPVGGGSINETFKVSLSDGTAFFCKMNSATKFPHLFEQERKGLERIGKQGVIRVPEVIGTMEMNGWQLLLLEWIGLGERTDLFWKKFGEQLAMLHQKEGTHYGSEEDNYMGSVPQRNQWEEDWISFFIHQRLRPLATQCATQGLLTSHIVKQLEQLYLILPTIFDVAEKPCLVHGDLWSGNFMCDNRSLPVLIDPASYYGHRSVDLAMTTLFGGFRAPFYEAYHYHYPLPSNYEEQWQVCNLYPLLIHLLLFGSSYLPQIESTLQQFV
jgi:fructosamine-3-kinase